MIHSFYDKKGMLYVDCTECERGFNGGAKDKCSAGWNQKRPGLGCFCGELIKVKDIIPGNWRAKEG